MIGGAPKSVSEFFSTSARRLQNKRIAPIERVTGRQEPIRTEGMDVARIATLPVLAATTLLAVLAVGLRAQPADTISNPFAHDPAAAAQGKPTFEGTCAVCHGAGGTGGRGPALNGGRFTHGDEDADLFKTIHDGLRGTDMPSFAMLPANDIWKIVSYVRSLSGGSASTSVVQLKGNAKRGEALFHGDGGCAACHEVNGRGSVIGPDLSAEGARDPGAIRTAMAHPAPTRQNAASVRWVNVVTGDGKKLHGVVRAEDSFSLAVIADDGALVRVDRLAAKSIEDDPAPRATMTAVAKLPEAQREDLLAYLAAQKKRDVSGKIAPSGTNTLPAARLLGGKAESGNWLTYWGGYDAHHFSPLTQINAKNAFQLQARWTAQLPGPSQVKGTPLVIDGIMYASGSPGEVQAIDARTGQQLWKFNRKQDVTNPYQINATNRGVAVLDGRVFVTTLDNLVIAIDAKTGRELWETRAADTLDGFEMTGAPLALPGKIIVGVGGGEFGLRGFLDAYDPATGERLWRFQTIPGPGELGHETWPGDSWKLGGGGTWLTGSYDPELKTLYWAVGNPSPSFNPHVRAGDNLYTNSVIALDPDTGKLKWHYQFTPNDSHDWDSEEAMVLADAKIGGTARKLLLHADRNGVYYVLDRETGQFIQATAFVQQTWNDGYDANGRPKVRPETIASSEGAVVYPAIGGTNWQAPSYDAARQRFFVVFSDSPRKFVAEAPKFEKGQQYPAGRGQNVPGAAATQGVQAMDALTGKQLWRFRLSRGTLGAGVLATAGNIVAAGSADGNVIVLDSATGKPLWHFQTGGGIGASPISYSVDGTQYLAISAGTNIYAFALPSPLAGR
jgi:alcohol dehydrogenase (cytochrome c)